MRLLALLPFVGLFACTDATVPGPAATAALHLHAGAAAPTPALAELPDSRRRALHDLAATALRECTVGQMPPDLTACPDDAIASLLDVAAAAGPIEQGRAPVLVAAFGAAALPALTLALHHDDVRQRRLAMLALAQLGRTAEPAAAALMQAQQDPDPQVRALAEHALRRATGDTRELDRLRAQHEAATARDR